LPLIAYPIDGMLESANEQYEHLQQARPKPYVLDDYTVKRVIEVFTKQQNDLWLFDEQLQRWKAGKLTTAQRSEVERLVGQMAKLHQVIASILELAKELKEGTIEKQLAKSDEQLGLEFLLRRPSEQ
jgi:exosome complex RNA-binding protein Rrp4